MELDLTISFTELSTFGNVDTAIVAELPDVSYGDTLYGTILYE